MIQGKWLGLDMASAYGDRGQDRGNIPQCRMTCHICTSIVNTMMNRAGPLPRPVERCKGESANLLSPQSWMYFSLEDAFALERRHNKLEADDLWLKIGQNGLAE
jgi:hypothetical protein